jgi:tRNA(Met) C34 N-acetyltransferase TmcA
VYQAETQPESLTLVAAPTARQSAELVRKAARFARRLGRRIRGDGQNEISLLFPNGSRSVGLPGTEDNVRGFSAASLVVIDEAARVSDEMYRTLRRCRRWTAICVC